MSDGETDALPNLPDARILLPSGEKGIGYLAITQAMACTGILYVLLVRFLLEIGM